MLELVRKARPLAAAVVMAVLVAGCSDDDGTGPDTTFDEANAEAAAQATVDASTALTANEDAFQAISSVLGSIGGTAALSPAATMPFLVGERLGSRDGPRFISASSAPQAVPILPETVRGNTYVWSVEQAMYVADPERTDAPEDGILIVYYATNPATGEPVTPLSELGTVLLRDRGSETTTIVDLIITQTAGGTSTLADYTVSGSVTETASTITGTFDAEGFVRGDGERIDFDLHHEETSSDAAVTAELDYVLTNSASDVSLDLDFALNDTGDESEETVAYSVRIGANTLVFSAVATQVGATLVEEGDVTFNGTQIAVLNDGELTKPDGSALSAGEVNALTSALQTSGLLFLFSLYIILPFFVILL